MLQFQQYVKEKSFAAGGGKFVAPAQRMVDFSRGKLSSAHNCGGQRVAKASECRDSNYGVQVNASGMD